MLQGSERKEELINIFLEWVPAGSIAGMLTKPGIGAIPVESMLPRLTAPRSVVAALGRLSHMRQQSQQIRGSISYWIQRVKFKLNFNLQAALGNRWCACTHGTS